MNAKRWLLGLVLAVGLIIAACNDEPEAAAGPDTTADAVPTDRFGIDPARLPAGTHVGIAAFSPPDDTVADRWAARWDEANADATVGRIQLDWIDVEPEQGRYDAAPLAEQLADRTGRGQATMVTLAAVDLSGTEFPHWLGGFEPERAAAAYNRMLDEIGPLLDQHDVWLLAVANEPPFDDGLDRRDFARFVDAVADHAHATRPGLAVTFTFAGDHVTEADAETMALIDAVDVFSINHYCLRSDLTAIGAGEAAANLAEAMKLAGNLPVVFQEFGCPAAESLGSSEAFQAAWFSEAFALIADDPQVRAAFVFEMSDWSPELVDLDYEEAFADEPELVEIYDRLGDWLTTTGLVRADMSTRPAWDVYLANLGG